MTASVPVPVYATPFRTLEDITFRVVVFSGAQSMSALGCDTSYPFVICTDGGDDSGIVPFEVADDIESAIAVANENA